MATTFKVKASIQDETGRVLLELEVELDRDCAAELFEQCRDAFEVAEDVNEVH